MDNYLGETLLDINNTEFVEYDGNDWVRYYIEAYGFIDGADHKAWLLDQVTRIVCGTKVVVKIAEWGNPKAEFNPELGDYHWEHRIRLAEPSDDYLLFRELLGDGYDEGIAP